MRIIAGRFKGFEVRVPAKGTRPTTDRTKEAVFSHLESMGMLNNTRILDLYAGSGALGIEALSRGASTLVAVEAAGQAANLLRTTFNNLKKQHAWQSGDSVQVIRCKAEQYAQTYVTPHESQQFDVVFIDPPYAVEDEVCNTLLRDLVHNHVVREDGVVILERSARSPEPQVPEDWEIVRAKNYGETAVYTIEHV